MKKSEHLRVLAVFREVSNSPNREHDDTLILKLVCEELSALGCETHLIEPSSLKFQNPADWDAVIPMCENPPHIKIIESWKEQVLVLNPMSAVKNCYRVNMTPLMEACPGIHPRTELRSMSDLPGRQPGFGEEGLWLKRGDVHNTCDHDVVRVTDWKDVHKVKADFATRSIKDVVLQEHIAGDVIKFYGVGPYKWFSWFYHRPQDVAKYRFDPAVLEDYAGRVAKAVGLEVFGGDAIVTPDSRIYIIDINSWPSFARVRDEVKTHIAKHVAARAKAARKEK